MAPPTTPRVPSPSLALSSRPRIRPLRRPRLARSLPPSSPPTGSAGYGDPAYGQPAYGQPAYGQQAYATPPKQWVLALVLAFFLGGFGVHNFYLGYTTRGIIQLLLTITLVGAPISAIWALIEFIMIIMRSGSYGYDASGQPLV